MPNELFWCVPAGAVLALAFAWLFYRQIMQEDEGTETMRRIAAHVRRGAMAYLKQQYLVVGLAFVVLTAAFSFLAFYLMVQNPWVPFAFLSGGCFSALSGFFGMKTATAAAARTANAARTSLNGALTIALRAGAVMGFVVVGLGLLDICVWFIILSRIYPVREGDGQNLAIITTTLLTFGMGASTQALFARVGGGIFTKAADVGADLVGKVEAGIPEDDPRNPATIADNVGDIVGDVAGMGADLYESYCGSLLATAALGVAAYAGNLEAQFEGVLAPLLVAAAGIVCSILGVLAVSACEGATQQDLLRSLAKGINLSSLLTIAFSWGIFQALHLPNAWNLWGCIVVGVVTGIVIGKATEYFTASSYGPTRSIAESARTGPATVIIAGLGTGMQSTAVPVISVVAATLAAYALGGDFDSSNVEKGLYGIGLASVGMLATLGITLATDAYGPIADNAGGNAQMSGLDQLVRTRTDALDSLGNTTAATGKGYAIGSAALTALALFASYIEELKVGLLRIGHVTLDFGGGRTIPTINARLVDFMAYYQVHLMNPKVVLGAFIGSMMAFLFCGLAINAVGRAAGKMVTEVRRQFQQIRGILEGTAEPDYAR